MLPSYEHIHDNAALLPNAMLLVILSRLGLAGLAAKVRMDNATVQKDNSLQGTQESQQVYSL
jgi:hypothetical protein